jgi:hypothetical protein
VKCVRCGKINESAGLPAAPNGRRNVMRRRDGARRFLCLADHEPQVRVSRIITRASVRCRSNTRRPPAVGQQRPTRIEVRAAVCNSRTAFV